MAKKTEVEEVMNDNEFTIDSDEVQSVVVPQ